jgi:signal transduction histidine kinase
LLPLRRGDPRALVIAIALLIAIGLLDYLTPNNVEFTLFYMIPVVLTAWILGWRTAVIIGLAATTMELAVDALLQSFVPAEEVWNGFSRFGIFVALAYVTDNFHRERIAKENAHESERRRWAALDADRNALQRMLIRELARPLRALDWFARTFEERIGRDANPAVHVHFRALRHQIQEATFLGTDLLSLERVEAETLHFERTRVDLVELLTEAADESPARNRVLLNVPKEPLAVIGDADRLRHAFACLIDRAVELSPQEDVTVMARLSAEEAAVEINCRTRELTEDDVELPRLLVEGNGGRLLLITRGAIRGSLAAIRLPLDPGPRKPTWEGEAQNTRAN